ncbi:HEPN domain-containing protein [bacterium]|nr:HEPN domain-containing protein [bacterium]
MSPHEDTLYRLRIAAEFLDRAEHNFAQDDWAGCVQQAQIVVENSAKAILAYVDPVPHTHEPHHQLEMLLATMPELPTDIAASVKIVIAACQHLGGREHVLATYGDEEKRLTPSQIFHQPEATKAIEHARNAASKAKKVINYFRQLSDDGL